MASATVSVGFIVKRPEVMMFCAVMQKAPSLEKGTKDDTLPYSRLAIYRNNVPVITCEGHYTVYSLDAANVPLRFV
jgi:hypothetical protein